MQQWNNAKKTVKSKNSINTIKMADLYKKEILDTRITVSKLARNSRISNFSNLKVTNKKIYALFIAIMANIGVSI